MSSGSNEVGVWILGIMAIMFCLFIFLCITLMIKIKNNVWSSFLTRNIFENMERIKEPLLTLPMIRNCFNESYLTTSFDIKLKGKTANIIFRPLKNNKRDRLSLTVFLENLSEQTREKWYQSSYDVTKAQEICQDVVNNKDLLIMVAIYKDIIIGMFEFNFGKNEIYEKRFRTKQGIIIDSDTDVRYTPCVCDDFHHLGIGTKAFQCMKHIAILLGKKRIIVWDGTSNMSALRYYKKIGFKTLKKFNDTLDGKECIDMIINIEN